MRMRILALCARGRGPRKYKRQAGLLPKTLARMKVSNNKRCFTKTIKPVALIGTPAFWSRPVLCATGLSGALLEYYNGVTG